MTVFMCKAQHVLHNMINYVEIYMKLIKWNISVVCILCIYVMCLCICMLCVCVCLYGHSYLCNMYVMCMLCVRRVYVVCTSCVRCVYVVRTSYVRNNNERQRSWLILQIWITIRVNFTRKFAVMWGHSM